MVGLKINPEFCHLKLENILKFVLDLFKDKVVSFQKKKKLKHKLNNILWHIHFPSEEGRGYHYGD